MDLFLLYGGLYGNHTFVVLVLHSIAAEKRETEFSLRVDYVVSLTT